MITGEDKVSSITPQQVQKLRERSGAGFMDCKRALESSGGDLDKAIQFLREKGKASAAQKSGRVTGQGLVCAWLDPDLKKGSLVELNCETDFVARTEDFQSLALRLAKLSVEKNAGDAAALLAQTLDSRETVESALKEKVAKLGENIQLRKAVLLGEGANGSLIGHYIHNPLEKAPQCGSLGVLVQLDSAASPGETAELLKELCMQVAAVPPKWVGKSDVPPAVVEKEKAIYQEQCRQSGKPEKAWDKIIEGKLADFYRSFCLMEQPHVRDASGRTPIRVLVEKTSAQTGKKIEIKSFVRFKLGEE